MRSERLWSLLLVMISNGKEVVGDNTITLTPLLPPNPRDSRPKEIHFRPKKIMSNDDAMGED